MKTNDIKKGTQVRLDGYGNTTCTVMDNLKGIRRMIEVKGSEVGQFDEIGSVWSHKILEAKVDVPAVRMSTSARSEIPYEYTDDR